MDGLNVVILAAGKGKRMNNPNLPKVLNIINDKPLIYYVITTAHKLNANQIVVVIGHHGELVKDYITTVFNSTKIIFVIQEQQLGTGHAVLVTEPNIDKTNTYTLILAGDIPNISVKTLKEFIDISIKNQNDISVLSSISDNPFGYGRIIRNNNNHIIKIQEHKDCNDEELKTKEINSGIILAKTDILFKLLNLIKPNNNQNEYYLTDIVELGIINNLYVDAYCIANFNEIQGINTIEELKKAENYKINMENINV